MNLKNVRLNLWLRLILVFLLIGLVPLVVTGLINIVLTSDVLRERVINDEQASVQRKANEIQRFLETTVDDIRLLSQSVAVREMADTILAGSTLRLQPAREAVGVEFQNYVENRRIGDRRVYARIRFLDQDGFEFVRVDDVEGQAVSVTNLNFRSNELYFTQAKDLPEGEIYVSPINLFDEYGRIQRPFNPVLQYSTPVYVDGEFVGVLVTDVQAQGFLDLVQANLPTQATAFLVDQDGYYLSHPDSERLFGRDLETGIRLETDFPALQDVISEREGDNLELENDIVFYQNIAPPGQEGLYWALFSLRPLDDVLSPARQQQNTLILALVIVGAVVTLAAFVFARSLNRPIVQLTRSSALIAGGNLKARVNIQRADEIGDLAQTFNSMTDQLSELIDHLEERVTDRTRDLQIAADVSRQITTVLDIDQLLQQVVALATQSFNLSAAFVFRLDEKEETLVRSAGVDAAGNILAAGPLMNIPLNAPSNTVALAASRRQAIKVNEVTALPAPLADTRSELAIPLVLGEHLLGVFDLHAKESHRFSDDDLRVLTSLAEQITIAVRNAQLFAETQAARQAAEQASKVKSQFLANMSHELRTPLNAILNFTGFVVDGVLGPVTDEQSDSLNKVINSGQHLLSLINDILDLTKIEIGMMELFVQEVDVNAALDSSLSTAKGLVKDKPITIQTEIEPGMPIIMGDKRRIRQILLNLISNAVKFTTQGSITIFAHHRDGEIHLAVRDTGIGIPEDRAHMVFDTFQQAHDLVDAPGTGLGMPITKAFVEAHGGRIWFKSQVGVGTTFFITLPVNGAATQAIPVSLDVKK
ncbi:MAG: GAF domain-containing protein [Chloroflexi bacterium]|nr:GAF domain-containing protein [Chloroflexota bacterium]